MASWPLSFTSTPPAAAQEIEEPELREADSEDDPELTEDPQGQSNLFLAPELDELVDNKISEDVWQQMLGELPCSVTTENCINQLQNTAIQNSRLRADMQSKIEEAENTLDKGKMKNLDSMSTISIPYCYYLPVVTRFMRCNHVGQSHLSS